MTLDRKACPTPFRRRLAISVGRSRCETWRSSSSQKSINNARAQKLGVHRGQVRSMSALGQERTFSEQAPMSTLPLWLVTGGFGEFDQFGPTDHTIPLSGYATLRGNSGH